MDIFGSQDPFVAVIYAVRSVQRLIRSLFLGHVSLNNKIVFPGYFAIQLLIYKFHWPLYEEARI